MLVQTQLHPQPQTDSSSSEKATRITRKTLLEKAYELWGKAKYYLNDDENHSTLTSDKGNTLAVLCLNRSYRLLTYLLVLIPWEGTSDSSTQDLMMADLEEVYNLGFEVLEKICGGQGPLSPFLEYIGVLLDRTNEIREKVVEESRASRCLTSFIRRGYHHR
jgi:hypothetical protein